METIKVGTELIAINECIMTHSKEKALILGKVYKVKSIMNNGFTIESEIDNMH